MSPALAGGFLTVEPLRKQGLVEPSTEYCEHFLIEKSLLGARLHACLVASVMSGSLHPCGL